jgi:hypothetical protein
MHKMNVCVCAPPGITQASNPFINPSLYLYGSMSTTSILHLISHTNDPPFPKQPQGALLGALLGASKGMAAFPPRFVDGLVDRDAIRREISAFADLAVKRSGVKKAGEDA